MPYIRLYSREVSLGEKRLLAEKLISITLRALRLRPEERDQITIQFVPRDWSPAAFDSLLPLNEATAVLEVSDHNLTVQKITAFVEAAAPMLSQSAAVKPPGRIARMLRKEADPARQIAFQFNDTSSPSGYAYGNAFAPMPVRKAA